MFQSYNYRKNLGYDSKTKLYHWEYKIIDSEFEEIGVSVSAFVGVGIAVIDTYEKRNLNVAANLIKSFIWYGRGNKWLIGEIVRWNKQYTPKFAKYEEQIKKYLILI